MAILRSFAPFFAVVAAVAACSDDPAGTVAATPQDGGPPDGAPGTQPPSSDAGTDGSVTVPTGGVTGTPVKTFGTAGYEDTGVLSNRIERAVAKTDVTLFTTAKLDAHRRVVRFAYDGTANATYNTNADAAIGAISFPLNDTAADVDEQGRAYLVDNTRGPASHVADIYRLAADGTKDETWGTNGALTVASPIAMGNGDKYIVVGLQLLADGSVLGVGSRETPNVNPAEWSILKLTPAGAADTTFGTSGGTVLGSTTVGRVGHRALFVDKAGAIYALRNEAANGNALVKLTAAGQLDTTFGSGGTFTLPDATVSLFAVATDDAGHVYLSGLQTSANNNGRAAAYVTRLTSAGQVDAAFGKSGVVATTYTDSSRQSLPWKTVFSSIWFDAQGRTVFGGNMYAQGAASLGSNVPGFHVLQRLLADGTPDPSFAPTGHEASEEKVTWGILQTATEDNDGHDAAIFPTPDGTAIMGVQGNSASGGHFRFTRFE